MANDAGFGFNTSFGDIIGGLEGLFGGSTSGNTNVTGEASSTTTATMSGEARKRLELDDDAIAKIIDDLLTGTDGLAAIFAGEQNAGIFNSSVANQAAGDLASKIVGELAKLTAEEVSTQEQEQTSQTDQTMSQQTKTKSEDDGLIKSIGNSLGF